VPLPCGSASSRERLEILDDERRVLSFRVVGWEIHGEISFASYALSFPIAIFKLQFASPI